MIHEEKLNRLVLFVLQKYRLSSERTMVFKCAKTCHKDGKELLHRDTGDKRI